MKKNGFLIFLCLFNCLTISQFSLAMEKKSEDEGVNLGKRKFDDSDSHNPAPLKAAKFTHASDHCFTISDMQPEIFSLICSYLSTQELSKFREVSIKDPKLVSMIDSEACDRIGKFMKGEYGEVNACSILSHVTDLHQKPDYLAYEKMITGSGGKFERVTFEDSLIDNFIVDNKKPCSRKNSFVNCIFHDVDYKIYKCNYENCKFMDASADGNTVKIVESCFNKCTFKDSIYFNVKGFVDFKDCILLGEVRCYFYFSDENSTISLKGCKINKAVFNLNIEDKRTDKEILEELRIAGAVWNDEMPPRIERSKIEANLIFRPL